MKKNFSILISGAGQIGSRYLQGLISVNVPLRIFVQDVSINALKMSESRWREVNGDKSIHRTSFDINFTDLPRKIDLCILATTADVRPSILKEITKKTFVNYWILEKVLCQNNDGLGIILQETKNASGVWVNMSRRVIPFHKQICKAIGNVKKLEAKVIGPNWGLACNSLHFIDYIAHITKEKPIKIQTSLLEKYWIKSKRENFWEVLGTLQIYFSGGTELSLDASLDELNTGLRHHSFLIRNTNSEITWDINEAKGVAISSDGNRIKSKLLFQSDITKTLVESILDTGKCELTILEESCEMHELFFEKILEHWRYHEDPMALSVPIT